jgi:hypothetical protein
MRKIFAALQTSTGWRIALAKLATLGEADYSKDAADQPHLQGTIHRNRMRQYDKA